MKKSPRLEANILPKVQDWLTERGSEFIISIKEFCQGNRAALCQVREYIKALGIEVFANERQKVDAELLDKLEYGMFDLIGKFSSTSGGNALTEAIRENIAEYITEIFAESKRRWDFEKYKLAVSFNEESFNRLEDMQFDSEHEIVETIEFEKRALSPQLQAKVIIDELLYFCEKRFWGNKTINVARIWFNNPKKYKDHYWIAYLVDSNPNSVKVIISRIKKALRKQFDVKKVQDKLIIRYKSAANPPPLNDTGLLKLNSFM
ncbi:MAG: hypothetical protein GY855_07550 [candidate division Zixibacteria bacterium]|nr:hypothetical protein [candidate division Zixibacteria bacterium]